MTEFAFDPYAALAKIQNQTLTPAKAAKAAKVAPEYHPPVETLATLAALAGVGVWF